MPARRKLKPIPFGDRIKQSEVIKLLEKKCGLSYNSALRYLRNYGPAPIEKKSQHMVWFRKSEIDEWLSQMKKGD